MYIFNVYFLYKTCICYFHLKSISYILISVFMSQLRIHVQFSKTVCIIFFQTIKFLGKREPTRTPHMQCYTNIEVMNVLAEKLFETQYNDFCGTTCFVRLSCICRCHIQAQLIRCVFFARLRLNICNPNTCKRHHSSI